MGKHQSSIFIRNSDGDGLIDVFLLSAVSAILLIRVFLHIANYPQIGTGSYHIAHMLWGGLLMMISILLSLGFFGRKIMRIVAIVGGFGFGIFLDELGKFITSDNNYFFQPTIGLIYATFVILYLTSRYVLKHDRFSDTELQLNALRLSEDVIRNDLDHNEKAEITNLLKNSKKSIITKKLLAFINDIDALPNATTPRYRKIIDKIDYYYENLLRSKNTDRLIQLLTFIFIVFSMIGIYLLFQKSYGSLPKFILDNPSEHLALEKGQILSTLTAQGFAYLGAIFVIKDRYRAFYLFNIALMINIFLTQFFMFARTQFDAIPFFVANMVLLVIVRFVLAREVFVRDKK